MSKKKNRPPSAQNLIDSLLDEKSSVKSHATKPAQPERLAFDSSIRPDDQTSSIVIDLQERIDERSGIRSRISRVEKSASAIDLGSLDTDAQNELSLSSPSVAKVPDPVARAEREARPAPPEKKASKGVHYPAPPTDDRTIQLEELKRAHHQETLETSGEAKAETKIQQRVHTPPNPTAAESGDSSADDRTQAVMPTSRTVSPKSETHRPVPDLSNSDLDDDAIATIDRMMPTEIKTRAGSGNEAHKDSKQKVAASNYAQAGGAAFSSAEASLKQSESLRVAQKRITELEQELERIRRENENLSTAGDTLRRRTDELLSKTEQLESQSRESEKIHEEEKKVFRGQLHQKDRDSMDLRQRLEEMEGRLENNFKKIRVRERELEHRLEIIKMESATLIAGKDKMILDLKRQIDQLSHENSYGKQKSAELFNQYKGKQDTIRRVVRALRIALTILEGDEDASSGSNKKND